MTIRRSTVSGKWVRLVRLSALARFVPIVRRGRKTSWLASRIKLPGSTTTRMIASPLLPETGGF